MSFGGLEKVRTWPKESEKEAAHSPSTHSRHAAAAPCRSAPTNPCAHAGTATGRTAPAAAAASPSQHAAQSPDEAGLGCMGGGASAPPSLRTVRSCSVPAPTWRARRDEAILRHPRARTARRSQASPEQASAVLLLGLGMRRKPSPEQHGEQQLCVRRRRLRWWLRRRAAGRAAAGPWRRRRQGCREQVVQDGGHGAHALKPAQKVRPS